MDGICFEKLCNFYIEGVDHQLCHFRRRPAGAGRTIILAGYRGIPASGWRDSDLYWFLSDWRILHRQKNEKKGIFVGTDYRRPLLQYSYFGGYCHGRSAAGKNRAGDSVGPALYGKRHAGRYAELMNLDFYKKVGYTI